VVIGTWDYAFLESVPAAENSMRRMAGLLAGPLCGWPQDQLLVMGNEPGPGDLPDRLITAFDGVSDVALFYYVGHGQIAPDDQLCLGLGQSRPEPNRRAATSLRFSDVRHALQDSGAAVKIVILDCCFAGLATTGTLAGLAGDVLDLTAGTGAYTMAATSAYATAWYEDSPGLARPHTYFTRYLADLVEDGIPGEPSRLRLDSLFRQLRDNLAADQRPVPSSRAVNDAREFAFAYNAAPPHTHRDPERDLTRLSQRLAETDVQIQALRAETAERAGELARLRQLVASTQHRDAGQQRELHAAIGEATRQLDDTRAQAARVPSPELVPRPAVTAKGPIPHLVHEPAGERVDESAKTPDASAAGEATAISAEEFARRFGRDSQQAPRILSLLRDDKSPDTLKPYGEWFKEAFPDTRGPQRDSVAGTRVPAGEDTPPPNRAPDGDPPTVSVRKNVTSPPRPRRRPASSPLPTQPDAPSTVLAAVSLMYAGATVSLVTTVVSLSVTSSQWWSDYPVSIIMWIFLARECRNGWRPTQAVGSVLFGIATLILPGEVTLPQSGIATICDVVVWLVGLGAVICLWRPASTAFFLGLRQNRRLPPGGPYGQYGPW
jgi:hypothetical protein